MLLLLSMHNVLLFINKLRNAKEPPKEFKVTAHKWKRSGERKEIQLGATPWGLCQLNCLTGATITTYFATAIEKIASISDLPGGFAVFCTLVYFLSVICADAPPQATKRVYVFICAERDQLLERLARDVLSTAGLKVNIGKADAGLSVVTFDYVQ